MPEVNTLTPTTVLAEDSPLVLTATLSPVAGLDRFQPAGFPEVGHVIYKAQRSDGVTEHVCIVDSAASMANHLESVCMRGSHDPDLVDELSGMPFLRCVTGPVAEGKLTDRQVVVTSLTEGHRLASTYFLGNRNRKSGRWDGKGGQRVSDTEGSLDPTSFGDALADEFGVALAESNKAHPPFAKWWDVFKTIFRYDPNALVHGVLFPQWQIKISRALTAHLEARGAGRVDRSGVKFDRLGKTTSGQPIFAVDDAIAKEIRATFILDIALIRSFGRKDGNKQLGLSTEQQQFLVALALWKVDRLLKTPFRFRSGCHLQCLSLKSGDQVVEIDVSIKDAITSAGFDKPPITDIYWPTEELYREASDPLATEESGSEGDGEPDGEDAGE